MLDEPRVSVLAANPWVARRPITVAEYHRMGEVGILGERDRVELIEGELVAMSPTGSNHHGTVMTLTHSLVHAVGERAIVSVQGPVRLDDHSEPEPDFALLRPRADFYRDAHAQSADVLLLIEVADTSLNYDRAVKRALHARHAIPEFWIVNLASGEVEVCREPKSDGYAVVERVGRGGALEPRLLPGVRIPGFRPAALTSRFPRSPICDRGATDTGWQWRPVDESTSPSRPASSDLAPRSIAHSVAFAELAAAR